MRFEKFVADNEAKRSRALKKYEAAQEENVSKQSHIEELTEELERLKVRWGRDSSTHLCLWRGTRPQTGMSFYRQQVLKKKIQKHKIYEDYLLKTLDYFPSSKLAPLCSPSRAGCWSDRGHAFHCSLPGSRVSTLRHVHYSPPRGPVGHQPGAAQAFGTCGAGGGQRQPAAAEHEKRAQRKKTGETWLPPKPPHG